MDFLGIEAFLAVVRMQGISKAAQQLHLAQSTVSKRLQVLEHSLGVSLFERKKGNHPLRLTEAGERLLEPAERCLALQTELENLHLAHAQYRLSIGSLASLNYAVFPKVFHALSEHKPRLILKVTTSHSADLYDLMEARQIDVGFTLLKRDHPFINVEPYHTDQIVGICLTDAPYGRDVDVHPYELDSNNELFVNWGTEFTKWHEQWWDKTCSGRIVLDTPQLIFSFFSSEKQWAAMPLSMAQHRMERERDAYRLFRFSHAQQVKRISYKITHKNAKASTLTTIKFFDRYYAETQKEKKHNLRHSPNSTHAHS